LQAAWHAYMVKTYHDGVAGSVSYADDSLPDTLLSHAETGG
jgi:hypothetical protein